VLVAENGYSRLANRLLVRKTGSELLDKQATDGYVWGTQKEITYWMPLPLPPKKNFESDKR
jgi:hypothetical protein